MGQKEMRKTRIELFAAITIIGLWACARQPEATVQAQSQSEHTEVGAESDGTAAPEARSDEVTDGTETYRDIRVFIFKEQASIFRQKNLPLKRGTTRMR